MKSSKIKKSLLFFWLSIVTLYLFLLIPDSSPKIESMAINTPFVWDQDDYWDVLESQFIEYKAFDDLELKNAYEHYLSSFYGYLDKLTAEENDQNSLTLSALELSVFQMAAIVAVDDEYRQEYTENILNLRRKIKTLSESWDVTHVVTRDRLYRLIYGSRMALEEIILQNKDTSSILYDYYNNDNECNLGQLSVKSGDILVSRGGAPTSALIARGNDYPGNFSHVALVHVDDKTGKVSIIESHIEIGVAITTPEEYLKDKKLRILQLRVREDQKDIINDTTIPHRAATFVMERTLKEHIPYDFEMDYKDDAKLFCSEVASSAYRNFGIELWMGVSYISSTGVREWLAAFGVKNFVTQEPSDLEYDPQLNVIAEWINPNTLFQDHIDNAVIDVMLEDAEEGERLEYNNFLLPFARVLKAYSMVKNKFGSAGPIPEGMSATSALKNDSFSGDHVAIKNLLKNKIALFEEKNGYRPPYWQLIKLARLSKDEYDLNSN